MHKLRCAILLIAALGGAGAADAQTYPSRPITMVVPYSAGGPTDTIARIMAERMRGPLGQIIVVENVTGAAGTIGVGKVARAAADGYSISIGHWGTHVVNPAIYALQYDALKDFEPVAMIATNPCRRGWRARPAHRHLACALDAQGHADGRHRQAQRSRR
jgi:tripartite-type tricarboxylate transporter receptor subunit TctC